MEEDTPVRSKRAASLGLPNEIGKKQNKMIHTSRRLSENSYLSSNLREALRRHSSSSGSLQEISSLQNHQSSTLHRHLLSHIHNGQISFQEQWLTSIMSSQEVSPSPMTTERLSYLAGWRLNSES
jgi:hypothetical protein